jgi:uncharacterized protein
VPIFRTLATVSVLILGLCLPTQAAEPEFDPVTDDPVVVDRQFPPSTVQLSFQSKDATLYGFLYLAQGKGPHPTIVLLHGFPGYEQNLDLAQALRRAGFNVLAFHYRGSWGSEGTYSLINARDDVAAAIRFLRSADNPAAERIDPARLGLIGHSLGGFLALEAAAMDKFIVCTAALAPANMGVMAEAVKNNPDYRASLAADTGEVGPIKGVTGLALIEELENHPEFDVTTLGADLAPRPLLLIGASNDTVLPTATFHNPIAIAYHRLEWPDLEVLLMDGDHAFSWSRVALSRKVVDWAQRACTGTEATN